MIISCNGIVTMCLHLDGEKNPQKMNHDK